MMPPSSSRPPFGAGRPDRPAERCARVGPLLRAAIRRSAAVRTSVRSSCTELVDPARVGRAACRRGRGRPRRRPRVADSRTRARKAATPVAHSTSALGESRDELRPAALGRLGGSAPCTPPSRESSSTLRSSARTVRSSASNVSAGSHLAKRCARELLEERRPALRAAREAQRGVPTPAKSGHRRSGAEQMRAELLRQRSPSISSSRVHEPVRHSDERLPSPSSASVAVVEGRRPLRCPVLDRCLAPNGAPDQRLRAAIEVSRPAAGRERRGRTRRPPPRTAANASRRAQ